MLRFQSRIHEPVLLLNMDQNLLTDRYQEPGLTVLARWSEIKFGFDVTVEKSHSPQSRLYLPGSHGHAHLSGLSHYV